jgi:hypothetical protein
MLTNAELNHYTRVPNLLAILVEEMKDLTKEVKELKEELKKKNEE